MTGPRENTNVDHSFASWLTKLVVRARVAIFGETIDGTHEPTSKVWVTLAVISLVLIIGGHTLGRFGLMMGFLLALLVNTVVFFYADVRLASLFPGQEIEGQDAWGLVRQAKDLAQALGLKAPPLVIVNSSTPLAFSAGLLPRHSKIYVSNMLLERLTPEEVRIVLAYELHRMKTQQTAAATAAAALVSFITMTARLIDDVILFRWTKSLINRLRSGRPRLVRHVGIVKGPMTLLVSPLVALIVRASIRRKAIFNSDHVSGSLTGTGNGAVARTLWKLDSYAKTRPFPVNLAEAHLFTVSPLTRYPAWRFASAQPPIEARLKSLTGFEPL